MKYIDLPKPHGYLIWKGKQRAIVSPDKLPTGEKMLLIQDGKEAFGEIVLGYPSQISLSEFERLETEHSTRAEERKLNWPNHNSFYLYGFKDWHGYPDGRDVEINNGYAEVLPMPELTEDEVKLLEQAERLPKTLVLRDEAVILEDGKVTFCEGLDGEKIMPILQATLDEKSVPDLLPLYQLALVRTPRLKLKKNMEADMLDEEEVKGTKLYKMLTDQEDCKFQIVKLDDDEVMGCHDNEQDAMAQMTELEEKGRAPKKQGGESKRTTSPKQPKEAGSRKDSEEPVEEAEKELVEEPEKELVEGPVDEYEEAVKSRSFTEWIDDYYAVLDDPIANAEKAVWTAKFVNDLPDSSFLHIVPNCGDKDESGKTAPRSCRMFPVKTADGTIDLPHLRNAIARAPQASTIPEETRMMVQKKAQAMLKKESEGEKAGKKVQANMLNKIKAAWSTLKEFMDWAEPMVEEDDEEMKMLGEGIGMKKVGDDWWYITYSTNAFKDRENEIFATKALEQYVTEAEKKEDRGYFNLWHIPGTDFAEKKWQGVVGRFLVESGPFLKDKKGQAALKFFKEYANGHKELAPEGWGCSPEYRYLPEERKTGTYDNVWITRTSTLPKMAAANIWTQGGMTMALTKEQQKAAEAIFGEELTKEIVKVAEEKTKELEEAGVDHKGITEEQPSEEQPAEAVEEPKELDEEIIVTKLAEKMAVDWEPLKAMLEGLVETQKALEAKIGTLESQLSFEKQQEDQKAKDESPKYVWRLFEKASEAQKTLVADDDPLNNMKPVEAQKSDKSGASHFFGNK